MKKIIAVITAALAAFASFACLTACNKKSGYDLSYTSWNLGTAALNNVERQMIKEFEKRENVKVRIEESIAQGNGYDDSIKGLAVKNNLPDVFMLSNINFGLKEKYASNIKDLVEADASGDWAKIPAPIEEGVHFKSGIYAVPFAMHMMGYFVNADLLEQYNLDKNLEGEFTWDKFSDIVTTMANYKSSGVIGLSHENTIFEWYPSSQNENYGWFTWDGSKYHLDSPEFSRGIELTQEFRTNKYTYDSLTEEDRAQNFEGVDGYTQLWNQGRLALRWGYSYEVPDMIKNTNGEFNIKFLGVPGNRTPMVGDYLAISTTCKNRELAYKFAKWMSFDPAGIRKRIELDKDVTNTLPLTTDATVIGEYFDKFTAVSGMEEKYATLDNGIVEAVKVIPGYNRSRWLANTKLTLNVDGVPTANISIGKLLDLCWTGSESYAEYATNANTLANEQYTKAIAEYTDFYN